VEVSHATFSGDDDNKIGDIEMGDPAQGDEGNYSDKVVGIPDPTVGNNTGGALGNNDRLEEELTDFEDYIKDKDPGTFAVAISDADAEYFKSLQSGKNKKGTEVVTAEAPSGYEPKTKKQIREEAEAEVAALEKEYSEEIKKEPMMVNAKVVPAVEPNEDDEYNSEDLEEMTAEEIAEMEAANAAMHAMHNVGHEGGDDGINDGS